MDIDDLLDPPLVALDLEGKAIYQRMLSAEAKLAARLAARGCGVWRQRRDDGTGGRAFGTPDGTALRRWLVLVPQPIAPRLRKQWLGLVARLAPSRQEFIEYLAARKTDRTTRAGEQSVASPTWLHPDKVVRKATWTTAAAYRAGTLSDAQVLAFLAQRQARCHELIDNAKAARQRQRVFDYQGRLAGLETDIGRMKALLELTGSPFTCRVLSGTGTYLRLCFTDRTSHSTSIQHILVATAGEHCELERAARHRRAPRNGEPLMTLYGGRLCIYLDETGLPPEDGPDSAARLRRLQEIRRFVDEL